MSHSLVQKDDGSTVLRNDTTSVEPVKINADGTITLVSLNDYGIEDDLFHTGDTNTKLTFADDKITLTAGGVELITLTEDTQDSVVVNNGATDVDFTVKKNTSGNAIAFDAGTVDLQLASTTIGVTGVVTVTGATGITGATEIIGAATQNGGNTIFNSASGDYDFTVKKNTSGNAIAFDAGTVDLQLAATTIGATGAITATGAVTQTGGNVIINNGAGDYDVTIKKNTSGNAWVYDAGLDTHTFSGQTAFGSLVRQSVSDALTAAGTTRTDALALTAQVNNVTTAASGTGVILPAGVVGAVIYVFNAGANAIQVYAAGSDTIDTVAGSTGVPLTNAKRCVYICVAANTYISAQLGVVSA